MGISTHVLDTAAGRPAAGIAVTLERFDGELWSGVAAGTTDADGRVGGLVANSDLTVGDYRIAFQTGAYFAARDQRSFHPQVAIEFTVHDAAEHYHVPVLLTPWSYSTYRGS